MQRNHIIEKVITDYQTIIGLLEIFPQDHLQVNQLKAYLAQWIEKHIQHIQNKINNELSNGRNLLGFLELIPNKFNDKESQIYLALVQWIKQLKANMEALDRIDIQLLKVSERQFNLLEKLNVIKENLIKDINHTALLKCQQQLDDERHRQQAAQLFMIATRRDPIQLSYVSRALDEYRQIKSPNSEDFEAMDVILYTIADIHYKNAQGSNDQDTIKFIEEGLAHLHTMRTLNADAIFLNFLFLILKADVVKQNATQLIALFPLINESNQKCLQAIENNQISQKDYLDTLAIFSDLICAVIQDLTHEKMINHKLLFDICHCYQNFIMSYQQNLSIKKLAQLFLHSMFKCYQQLIKHNQFSESMNLLSKITLTIEKYLDEKERINYLKHCESVINGALNGSNEEMQQSLKQQIRLFNLFNVNAVPDVQRHSNSSAEPDHLASSTRTKRSGSY